MNKEEFIPWAKPDFWGKEQDYVLEALQSTWISGGPFVVRFEREFADYCNVPYALTSSNGTTALQMAYLALGIKPGDEVIVPGFSFLAVANVAIHIGATPVFAEVDPSTWCVRAEDIEKCLSPRTKLIVPVHTYGNVCSMDDILALGRKHNIPVVEDTAEAFASRYHGHLAGTMGIIGSFSFQATKMITTGEGGMVITADEELNNKMALYRSHGLLRKTYYWHELAGYNFRLTNLQAALGVAQMERLDIIISERKRVYRTYRSYMDNLSGITMQFYAPDADVVPWAIAIILDPIAFPQGRDMVINQMKESRIETRPGFYTPSQMPHIYNCPALPVCESIAQQVISLPTYPTLKNEQIEYICNTLKTFRK